jgi:phospholipase/carboxylesterase
LLHGFGADEYDLFSLSSALDRRLFVISPRAPYALEWGGYAWHGLRLEGPNENPRISPDLATQAQGRRLLSQFVKEIQAHYPLDPDRLYLLGFSQGGFMAAQLMLTEPERVAGAILISSFFQPPPGVDLHPERLAGKPLLMIHGQQDPMIPLARAHAARDYFRATPARFEYAEYPMGHEIAPAALRHVIAWLAARLDEPVARNRPPADSPTEER